MKNKGSRPGGFTLFKWSLFWLPVLLTTVWVSGCAHTHVATINAVDPDVLDGNRPEANVLEHPGIWESRKHKETWYLWDRPGGLNILIKDKDGDTGNFGFDVIVTDKGGELMFMVPDLLSFMELSIPWFEFSVENQTVIHPVVETYHLEKRGQNMVLSELRPGWIKKMAKKEPDKIQFIEIEDTVLVTSPPADLVEVLESQEDFHAAFREFRVLEYIGELP